MESRIIPRLTEISHQEALRYLGIRGNSSGTLPEEQDLSRCETVLRGAVRPRVVWRLFDLESDGFLAGTSFRPEGESIRALLRGCDGVILMAATLGAEVDLLLRRESRRNLVDAAMLDALANTAIENVCDNLCLDLAQAVAPRMLTPRFSPGYGDFPLAQQAAFCSVLDVSRRIGVSLTSGSLMVPQKSVTALLGVSAHPPAARIAGCDACNLSDRCLYRKEGLSCGQSSSRSA